MSTVDPARLEALMAANAAEESRRRDAELARQERVRQERLNRPQAAANVGQTQANTQGTLGETRYTTDPYERTGVSGYAGSGNITGQEYGAQQQEILQSQLNQDLWNQRLNAIQGLGGGSGGVSPGGMVTHPGAGVAGNEPAARAAAFARAKEQAGLTAQSALQGLRESLGSRGMLGSTEEARGTGAVIGGAGQGLNQFTRDQMILDLNRAADISDQVYQGNIQQRGQNIGAQQQAVQQLWQLMGSGKLY